MRSIYLSPEMKTTLSPPQALIPRETEESRTVQCAECREVEALRLRRPSGDELPLSFTAILKPTVASVVGTGRPHWGGPGHTPRSTGNLLCSAR